jgi:hypothetical protein
MSTANCRRTILSRSVYRCSNESLRKSNMKMRDVIIKSLDFLISPAVYISGELLKNVRRIGVESLPLSKRLLLASGVFPIRDHYYEPLFNPRHLRADLSTPRYLPGIDWNLDQQISLLSELEQYSEDFPYDRNLTDNPNFGPGDAEVWFAMIRHLKPKRIVEVGSGYSTRIARAALMLNEREGHPATHVCIEPYEMQWLETSGATIIRDRIQDVGHELFTALSSDDILFIDSSHVIRPQGDVITEILEILPILAPGVVVHFHDIFSPCDYPKRWIVEQVRLWNEQYMLEAFLSHNHEWAVLAALNHLRHTCYDKLARTAKLLTSDRQPGSFYIRRNDWTS